jgi:nitroimidazol reductase NimA-like FMN-containing flavoprotein (pyridoxamine 5'-phosphate oxidase superfamily)
MEITANPVVQELTSNQSWQLLRDAPVGRLAVLVDGRPDIFPLNHVVDRGSLVFRSDKGTKLLAAVGQQVAYEVDGYDDATGEAWSVVLKGRANEVRQLHDVIETVDLPLFPWQGGVKPRFVRIEVDEVTGRRFARAGRGRRAASGYGSRPSPTE